MIPVHEDLEQAIFPSEIDFPQSTQPKNSKEHQGKFASIFCQNLEKLCLCLKNWSPPIKKTQPLRVPNLIQPDICLNWAPSVQGDSSGPGEKASSFKES